MALFFVLYGRYNSMLKLPLLCDFAKYNYDLLRWATLENGICATRSELISLDIVTQINSFDLSYQLLLLLLSYFLLDSWIRNHSSCCGQHVFMLKLPLNSSRDSVQHIVMFVQCVCTVYDIWFTLSNNSSNGYIQCLIFDIACLTANNIPIFCSFSFACNILNRFISLS